MSNRLCRQAIKLQLFGGCHQKYRGAEEPRGTLVALLDTFVATCTTQKLMLLAAHSPRGAIGMTAEVFT